ncbi:MAG: hypothetical protein WCF92_03370 [bacterium]
MKIGIDFDDCIVNLCPALIDFYNKIDGTAYSVADSESFDLGNLWKIDTETANERCLNFLLHEEKLNIAPVFGVVDALNKLKEKHELIIVTGRPEATKDFMVRWLNKHSINFFSEIIFSSQFNGEKRGKAEICIDEKVDIFIDDNLQNILDIAKEKIKCFLMDTPWNQELVPEYAIRVKGWKEIMEEIN